MLRVLVKFTMLRILNNDLGVAALLLERQVHKKLIWEKE